MLAQTGDAVGSLPGTSLKLNGCGAEYPALGGSAGAWLGKMDPEVSNSLSHAVVLQDLGS